MVKKNGELTAAFEDNAGLGLEEVTHSDMQIPFLRIIQALSPQIKKRRYSVAGTFCS